MWGNQVFAPGSLPGAREEWQICHIVLWRRMFEQLRVSVHRSISVCSFVCDCASPHLLPCARVRSAWSDTRRSPLPRVELPFSPLKVFPKVEDVLCKAFHFLCLNFMTRAVIRETGSTSKSTLICFDLRKQQIAQRSFKNEREREKKKKCGRAQQTAALLQLPFWFVGRSKSPLLGDF